MLDQLRLDKVDLQNLESVINARNLIVQEAISAHNLAVLQAIRELDQHNLAFLQNQRAAIKNQLNGLEKIGEYLHIK